MLLSLEGFESLPLSIKVEKLPHAVDDITLVTSSEQKTQVKCHSKAPNKT